MSNINIIRAWKDADYRNSLSEAERAALPANPAGIIELTDAELCGASGGQLASRQMRPLPPIDPKPRTCNLLCPCIPTTSTITATAPLLW
jgi:mersacidin/lichenicidin family type 2 lantibiotic